MPYSMSHKDEAKKIKFLSCRSKPKKDHAIKINYASMPYSMPDKEFYPEEIRSDFLQPFSFLLLRIYS